MNSKKDWKLIQEYYDTGKRYEDVCLFFKISQSAINRARVRGDFISRSASDRLKLLYSVSPKRHSDETKRKLSDIRIKYLEENPDKVPYMINHSSKKSYPEILFENALKSSGIVGWEYGYRCGIYCYDFAFPLMKVDVEIDGVTHKTEKVKKIDFRRDSWTRSNGWVVIRFESDRVKSDIVGCINELKTILGKAAADQTKEKA